MMKEKSCKSDLNSLLNFTTSKFDCIYFIISQVEDSLGRVGVGEREFLISPQLGSAVMNTLGHTVASDHRVTQIKKPFDWMFDEQFHNLQV